MVSKKRYQIKLAKAYFQFDLDVMLV